MASCGDVWTILMYPFTALFLLIVWLVNTISHALSNVEENERAPPVYVERNEHARLALPDMDILSTSRGINLAQPTINDIEMPSTSRVRNLAPSTSSGEIHDATPDASVIGSASSHENRHATPDASRIGSTNHSGNISVSSRPSPIMAPAQHTPWQVQIKCSVLAFFGGIMYGYSLQFTGGLLSMPNFFVMLSRKLYIKRQKAVVSNFCSYINKVTLIFSVLVPFGTSIGLLLGLKLKTNWGPKTRIVIGSITIILSTILAVIIKRTIAIGIFFFLIGLGNGIIREAIQSFYNQIALDENTKERIGNIFSYSYFLGSVLALLSNYLVSRYFPTQWKLTIGVLTFVGVMLIVTSIALRNIEIGDVEKPFRALSALLRQHKRVFLVKLLFVLLPTFMGLSQLVFYGPLVLESFNLWDESQFLAPLIGAATSFFFATVVFFLLPRIGKRRLIIVSLLTICVSQFIAWIIFHFAGSKRHHFKSPYDIFIAIFLLATYIGYYMIDGPFSWTDLSYPKQVEGIGNTLESSTVRFASGLMNLLVPFSLCVLNKSIFIALAGFALVHIVIYRVVDIFIIRRN